MLTKESKMRVLENFYSLDYLFFGKPVKKMASCCQEAVEEYITTKGALMSLMVEFYKLIDHKPEEVTEIIKTSDLVHMAKGSAKVARENAETLVSSDKGREDIKVELQEAIKEDSDLDIETAVKEKIRKKAFGLGIDNMLVARSMSECDEVDKLNEWEGKIVEDAYKTLRESLVESALFIIESNELFKDDE